MANEFIQIISVLLALGGIGVDANPTAPNTEVIFAHAPADADYVAHLDLQSFVPRNYRVFTSLPTAPSMASNPSAKAMIETSIREAEMGLGMLKGMTGFDPIGDLHSLTAWVSIPASGDPKWLVVARGKLPADFLERITAATGMPSQQIDGRAVMTTPDGNHLIGLTAGGDLLAGSIDWVKPRLEKAWKPVLSKRDARGKALAGLFDKRPFLAAASSPSATAATRLSQEFGRQADAGERFALELMTHHQFAGLSVTHNAMGWTYTANDTAGLDRASAISSAVIDLMRASHLIGRGVGTLAFEALEMQRGSSPEIDAVLAHKDALSALLAGFLGDGSFKTKVDKNAKAKSLTVWASGRKISDVIPIVGLMPVAGALFFVAGRDGNEPEVAPQAAEVVEQNPFVAAPRNVDPRDLFMELIAGY